MDQRNLPWLHQAIVRWFTTNQSPYWQQIFPSIIHKQITNISLVIHLFIWSTVVHTRHANTQPARTRSQQAVNSCIQHRVKAHVSPTLVDTLRNSTAPKWIGYERFHTLILPIWRTISDTQTLCSRMWCTEYYSNHQSCLDEKAREKIRIDNSLYNHSWRYSSRDTIKFDIYRFLMQTHGMFETVVTW